MGGIVSFCPLRDAADFNDQHCPRSQRHCSTHGNHSTATHNASADTIAGPMSRNLLVVVDDEDSPIKNRAEYAKSPTVAERIEQEVEKELRRRRQYAEDEVATKEINTNKAKEKTIDRPTPNHKREGIYEDVEHRDEVQHTER